MNENTMAPPLDQDLNSIDTSFHLIKDSDAIYEIQVESVESGMSSSQAAMLKLKVITIAPTVSTEGKDLAPGIGIFENINLQPSGKATWDMVTRNVGAVVQCLVGTSTSWGDFVANAPTLLQGKTGRVKIGYEPAGVNPKNQKAFKAKNVIKLWLPKNAA